MTAPSVRLYPAKTPEVYWFTGCSDDILDPSANAHAMALLKSEGVTAIEPHMGCCGRGVYDMGYSDQAIQLATFMIAQFNDDIPVLTLSSECVAFVRNHLPHLLIDHELEEAAAELAARTFHWAEYMWHVCKPNWTDRGAPIDVMFHTSCEERSHTHNQSATNQLLGLLKQVKVTAMPTLGQCCGANQIVQLISLETTDGLLERILKPMLNKPPAVLLGNHTNCLKRFHYAMLGRPRTFAA